MSDTPTDSEDWLRTAPALPYAGQYDAKAPDAGYPVAGSVVAAMSAPHTLQPASPAGSAVCPPPPDARRHRGSTPPPGSVFRPVLHENNESADLPCKADPERSAYLAHRGLDREQFCPAIAHDRWR